MNVHAHMEEVGDRWLAVLHCFESSESLIADVNELTDAFFQRHPHVARSPRAEAFIAGLALDRLATTALSACPQS